MICGTYLVLYLVKWEWMNDHCRENYILAYMVTSLINMSVELIPWWETWYLNLYGCKFGKMNVVKLLWRENKILAYMLRSLINGKFELVPRCPLMRNMICEPIWFCIRYNECIQIDPFAKMRFWPICLQVW